MKNVIYLIDDAYWSLPENVKKAADMLIRQDIDGCSLTVQFEASRHSSNYLPDLTTLAAVLVAVRGNESAGAFELLKLLQRSRLPVPIIGFLPCDSSLHTHFNFVSPGQSLHRNRKRHPVYTSELIAQFNHGFVLGDVFSAIRAAAEACKV